MARLACSVRPKAKAAYAAHAVGSVGAPPAGHHTWHVCGGTVTGGGSGNKMLLGRWHKQEWRTTNLPNIGRTIKARRGRLPMVRGGGGSGCSELAEPHVASSGCGLRSEPTAQ
jgi:hypothetical protein